MHQSHLQFLFSFIQKSTCLLLSIQPLNLSIKINVSINREVSKHASTHLPSFFYFKPKNYLFVYEIKVKLIENQEEKKIL